MWHMFLRDNNMAVANTYFEAGPTYEGRGKTSIIDYVVVPKTLMPRVKDCRVWQDAAKSMQISRKFKDHMPLVVKDGGATRVPH